MLSVQLRMGEFMTIGRDIKKARLFSKKEVDAIDTGIDALDNQIELASGGADDRDIAQEVRDMRKDYITLGKVREKVKRLSK